MAHVRIFSVECDHKPTEGQLDEWDIIKHLLLLGRGLLSTSPLSPFPLPADECVRALCIGRFLPVVGPPGPLVGAVAGILTLLLAGVGAVALYLLLFGVGASIIPFRLSTSLMSLA